MRWNDRNNLNGTKFEFYLWKCLYDAINDFYHNSYKLLVSLIIEHYSFHYFHLWTLTLYKKIIMKSFFLFSRKTKMKYYRWHFFLVSIFYFTIKIKRKRLPFFVFFIKPLNIFTNIHLCFVFAIFRIDFII